jgi:arylsulfatase A-like enzyme
MPLMVMASTDQLVRPNILFIITDQQSAESMSCVLGDEHLQTPNMDRLAAQGTRFANAYCAHPVCIPSRASMFSGRYPQETGILSFAAKEPDYATSWPSLGRIFKDQGYDTGYTGKWHIPIDKNAKELHGFDFHENIMSNKADVKNSETANRFLRQERDNPFLLVVSFNNPHNICEWARGARGSQLPDGDPGEPPAMEHCPPLRANHLPARDETDTIALLRRSYQASRTFPVGDFGEKEWREYVWAYYRMIEVVDLHIGEVLQVLQETGQDKNTVIVLTSDHGDCQGAHDWNQKTVFFDESIKVPFIIAYPGMNPGSISEQLVHTGVDLMPTLCETAGIPAPEGLSGHSLLPIVLGNETVLHRNFITAQTQFLQGAKIDGQSTTTFGRMVRSKQYKYCVYNEGIRREALFDMENDPGEMVNLAGLTSHRTLLLQHRQYLADWCESYDDEFPVPE